MIFSGFAFGLSTLLIANTIESKELLSKFIRVDAISKKSRELVGNKLPIEKFTELNKKFTEINKLIDEVIEFGTTENLFFDPQAQKFSTMKPKLVQLIADGKDKTAISKELNVNVKKVESWIKLLDSENKSLEKPSVTTTTKAAPKIAKVETKNVCDLEADMLHYSYDDYIHMIRTTEKFIKRGAILAHEEGKKATVFDPIIHGLGALFKALVLKGGAFHGINGWNVAVISAYSSYMKYAIMLDMQRNGK